ncbi:hypothetical protein MMC25_002614 [Agyrium rufum]|nr:hypothetical protein [Agyrium rufum]
MLCAISGEAPQVPVVSVKSGNVFEKRLIEVYIAENGTDPVTNEELTTADLIDLKTARTVRPRPPTLTSIPSLLSVFQNEWDALALESYTLKQQLVQTRQELSTALYQHDAAVRVIARVTRERDEARDALSKLSISGATTTNGEAMQVDSEGLPEKLREKVEATQEKLSKTRRKRAIPEGWATSETLETFKPNSLPASQSPKASTIALDSTTDLVLIGCGDDVARAYSRSSKEIIYTVTANGSVNDAQWAGSRAVIASNSVTVYDEATVAATFTNHAGPVSALAVHPSSDILASVGQDKAIVIYDLADLSVAAKVQTDSALSAAAFHPDGHLLAVGGTSGQIKIYNTASLEFAASFDAPGPVQNLAFSENGTWLASVSKNDTSIAIWDLRKMAHLKTLDVGSAISSIQWDYTGQFLAIAGPGGIIVMQYSKSSKEWSEPLRNGMAAKDIAWGEKAGSLIALSKKEELVELV